MKPIHLLHIRSFTIRIWPMWTKLAPWDIRFGRGFFMIWAIEITWPTR